MFSIIKEYINQSKKIEEDEEFDILYKELEEDILKIEEKRKKTVMEVLKSYAIAITLMFFLIFVSEKINFPQIVNVFFVIPVIVVMIKSISKFLDNKEEYINTYKSDILIRAIKKVNKDTIYFSKQRN